MGVIIFVFLLAVAASVLADWGYDIVLEYREFWADFGVWVAQVIIVSMAVFFWLLFLSMLLDAVGIL